MALPRGVCIEEACGLDEDFEPIPVRPGPCALRSLRRRDAAGVRFVAKGCSKGVSHRPEDR